MPTTISAKTPHALYFQQIGRKRGDPLQFQDEGWIVAVSIVLIRLSNREIGTVHCNCCARASAFSARVAKQYCCQQALEELDQSAVLVLKPHSPECYNDTMSVWADVSSKQYAHGDQNAPNWGCDYAETNSQTSRLKPSKEEFTDDANVAQET